MTDKNRRVLKQLRTEVTALTQNLKLVNDGLDTLAANCGPAEDTKVEKNIHAPHENCHGCSGVGTEHCPDVCDQQWTFNQGTPLPNNGGVIAVHDGTWHLPCLFRDYQTATKFHQLVNRCCQAKTILQPISLDYVVLSQIPEKGELFWVTLKSIDANDIYHWQVEQHPVVDVKIRMSLLIRVLQSEDHLIHKGTDNFVVWAINSEAAINRVSGYISRRRVKNAD